MGISKGTKLHMWSEEEKEYLEQIVEGKSHKEIQNLMIEKFGFNYKINQIKAAIQRYNLNTGRDGRFEKGINPWNKGTKGLVKAKKTSFKKGHIVASNKPAGTERITRDGYIEVKIENPSTWKHKHVFLWEKEYGPVPEGCVVMFADGNRSNFDIDNLLLVTKAQLLIMIRKKLRKDDKELTKIGLNIAKVYEKISQIKKEAKR